MNDIWKGIFIFIILGLLIAITALVSKNFVEANDKDFEKRVEASLHRIETLLGGHHMPTPTPTHMPTSPIPDQRRRMRHRRR